ncbi:hypothetical protein NKI19_02360 [Mesorhizobium sp. M0751]|uniref:hypothetical protein n=1 Tax=unclassified Mesorhizobium TaxID=325217 RepID=UPI003334E897
MESFLMPWEWRAEHRDNPQSTSAPLFAMGNTAWKIKGNISAEGERIYHLPGQKFRNQDFGIKRRIGGFAQKQMPVRRGGDDRSDNDLRRR